MRYRSDVQGLRCIAVLPVLVFHFGLSILPGGFTGVDIFFTISGFVIAASIRADIEAERFSVARFYFKRIRRVFPALGVVLLATSAAATALLLPDDLISYAWSLLAASTFWSNIYFWKSSGYFQIAAQIRPLLHTWSLSVEEQYYVVAPIAFALIHRRGGRCWLAFLLPVALASLALCIWAAIYAPTAGFFLLPTRTWELLIGALIGLGAWRPISGRGAREATAALGLLLVLAALLFLHETDPFPGWNALLPCLGTAFIIVAGVEADPLPVVGRMLSAAPLRWFGNISYSLYLVHWPIVAFWRYETLAPPTAVQAVLMIGASVAAAVLIFRLIEQPFRHVGGRHLGAVLSGGVLMIAGFAALAAVGLRAQGFPARFPDYHAEAPAVGEGWGGNHCFQLDPARVIAWDAHACIRARGSRGRILLWGDSFAAQYSPGFVADAPLIDADILQYTFAGCPPIFAYSAIARVGCAPSNRAVPALIRQLRVDTVLVAARWSETPRRTLLRLHETLSALKALGVRVIVIGQSPEFATDVQRLDYLSGNARKPVGAWIVAFDPELNRTIAAQARLAGVTFVNPIRLLCGGRVCTYRRGRTWFYADYGHLSVVGSALAVRRLAGVLAAPTE